MRKSPHTTKKGPGRNHAEGTYRNGKHHAGRHNEHGDCFGFPAAKLARKAHEKTIGH